MSLMRMPRVVKLRLEKIQRDFLWGGGALEKRPHLVKWAVVCSHKKKGGLGLEIFLLSIGPFCANGVSVLQLKGIPIGSLKLVGSLGKKEEGGVLVGNNSLCEAFPSLFALAVCKDAWVANCWDSMGEEGGWTPLPFPWSIIWSPDVPTKVGFFVWEASWGKVLTQDQLKRRGWILANRCSLCCAEKETINHILVHCSKAKVLWDLVFSLFGVNWVLPFTVKDTLLGWCASFKDKKHRKVWRTAPLCLFWRLGRKETR
ncbi:hypothetical protein CK203_092088 [Vitis vinifera]|uniref:Reverse transcriptase zinc-binding domain-containing protein n=1 Tax=Vitis vinifera TaxID=29760 RepID=A0A438CL90_VITVI|nr:hypothetical protein CK203_092088 [Vitis vinifera]